MKSINIKIFSFLLALLMIFSTFVACNTTTPPNETTPSVNQGTLPPTDSGTLPNTDPITLPNSDQTLLPNTDQATLPSTNIGTSTEQITLPSTYPGTTSTEQITLPSTYPGITSTEQVTLPSTYPGISSTDEVLTLPSIDASTDNYTDAPMLDTDTESNVATGNASDSNGNTATDNNGTIVPDTDAPSHLETDTIPPTDAPTETDAPATESNSETAAPDVEIDDSIINVFINGAYTVEFIRADLASSFEKTVYNDVRALFKAKTKVNPALKTDFVGVGKEPYEGPAILIGETSYQESKDVYKTLKDNQAIAKRVGNKYVIAFSSSDAATKLLDTIEGYLKKKATATEVKITDDWNATVKVTTSYSDNNNFSNSGLVSKIDITSLGLGTAYDAGQGCKTYVKTGATKTNFTSICTAIERAGATRYTGNTIGNNIFATYATQQQIIHVMFFPNRSEVRTAVDVRGTGTNGFTLPGLAADNKYTKKTTSEMIVCDISNADWPGGMCIIFKLADGRFFIIDAGIGGKYSDSRKWIGSSSGWIYATLAEHADDPKNIKVAGWLITHVHSDHAGGLYDMALGYHGSTDKGKHTVMPKEAKNYIKIENIIYNQPATTKFGRTGWMTTIINGFGVKNVIKAHPGQVFHYADLTITIYGAQDLMLEKSGSSGDLNDFSLVARTEFNGKTALFLGDSDTIPNPRLAEVYKTALKSDILQLAHHGYGDTGDADVNSYCNPSMVLWVVANRDQRSGAKINVNTSIASLSGVKHYKPGTGNLIFKNNWSTYAESASYIINKIPKCDGTVCGNKNCSIKSSTWNSYNS